MRQKDWFWCGAVLFALAMFISLQSVQEPLYSGIVGGLCALAAAILLGYGLRADAQEKAAMALKRMEEEQKRLEAQRQAHTEELELIQSMFVTLKEKNQSTRESVESEGQAQRESMATLSDQLREWFDAQQESYAVALNQFQMDITAVTEEIQALCKTIVSESQLHSNAFMQFSKDVKEYSESERTQTEECAKLICDLMREEYAAHCKVLNDQRKESTNYYKFMVDQPWAEVKALSETLQSIASQMDSMLLAIESIQLDTKNQVKNALEKLKEDSESLQEKLQYVCETLENQGRENRDVMERVMQGYSDITAQDVEVLTALAKDLKI